MAISTIVASIQSMTDSTVTLTGLNMTGSLTVGATVLATLVDETGTNVTGASGLTMLDVGGSPGSYTTFIPGTVVIPPGNYTLQVRATYAGGNYYNETSVNVPYVQETYVQTPGALATVTALKTYLGTSINDHSNDTLYARVIDRFTAYALNMCNRKAFLVQSYTEMLNGRGGSRISPKFAFSTSPIVSVTSINMDGTAIPTAPDTITSGFVFDDFTIYLRGYSLSPGIQNVSVTYTAGLLTITRELEQACLDACALWLKKREWIGKVSSTISGETVVFDKADIPETTVAVLRQFVRRK